MDFIGTIDSDDESSAGPSRTPRQGSAPAAGDDLDTAFNFDANETGRRSLTKRYRLNEDDEELPSANKISTARSPSLEVEGDHLVTGEPSDEDNSDEDDQDEEDIEDEMESSAGEDASNADPSEEEEGASEEEMGDEETAEQTRKDAFFDAEPKREDVDSSTFADMKLSRPLLRALNALSFTAPTPIQARAIPLALLGRDLLGSAVTGSGKTAAFMVPILERLCYRDRGKSGQACRVLILCPTRELAVQCESVGQALATKGRLDVRFALLVGGLSLNAQAHTLRTLPDILIATPGRLIDHLTNTPSFNLSALDVLVMDEADRMLEQGFADELAEIVKACPRARQTMLFSATMTDSVNELVQLSLNKPIRIFVDPKRSTASSLTQEFVRIRSDSSRVPSLLALCRRTVHQRCIIFFRSKALAHQMRVIFDLCGLRAAELHGNLTQEQRLRALEDFKAGKVDYLLATDLASRGLDIKGVEVVINYDMPGQLAQYTHRVGRTARAGRKGRSISLVGEADRKMLRAVVKQSQADQIRHRLIPAEAVSLAAKKLEDLQEDVRDALKEEKEDKLLQKANMEIQKGQNMIEHEAEIFSRPARTWFQSEKEKQAAKVAGKSAYIQSFPGKPTEAAKPAIKRGKFDGLSRKAKRRKMTIEAEGKEETVSSAAAIRAAKKSNRPVKMSESIQSGGKHKKAKERSSTKPTQRKSSKSAFDSDRGAKGTTKGRQEGMRAKPVKVAIGKKRKR